MTAPAVDVVTLHALEGAPYLAVDLQPDLTGLSTFVLDDSQLDGPDQLGYDATGSDADGWLNIVCDVTGVDVRRGATRLQGPLTRAEVGSAVVSVIDTGRRLDPLVNADAVHKGVPFRVRAWGYTGLDMDRWDAVLFTGEVDDVAVQYDRTDPPTVTISALDLIGRLAAWGSAGRPAPGVGAGDTLLARVERVLAELPLTDRVSADSDPQYLATLAPTVLAGGWDDVTAAQDAELGRVWVDRDNRLVVRSRFSRLSGPVRGTLSDVHDEAPQGEHCCIADASVVYGTETLTNRAVASRRIDSGGASVPAAVAQVDDEYSAARYGLHAYPASGGAAVLELQTDAQLAPWGQALVGQGTEPELRVDRVVPDPTGAPPAWPAVCITDVGDRWLFRMHPAVGPTVARTLGVLGLELRLTPDTWDVTWHTTDAPTPGDANPSGWFALDVSVLDEGDLLPPFSAPVAPVARDVIDGGVPVPAGATVIDGGTPSGTGPTIDGGDPW